MHSLLTRPPASDRAQHDFDTIGESEPMPQQASGWMTTWMRRENTEVLESAGLGGRAALALDAAGEGIALLVSVSHEEMIDVWRRARSALDKTARWPILVTNPDASASSLEDFQNADLFSRWFYGEEVGRTDCAPSNVLDRAAKVELDPFFEEKTGWDWIPKDDIAENLRWTHFHCGAAPDVDEVRRAITNDSDPMAVERYLLQWEIAHSCPENLRYQDWFTPPWPVALALLPVVDPWAVYAYVHALFGIDHETLVKASQRWNQRFGAEPVAVWGTMTQLFVTRRPRSIDDALLLAREHDILAPDTLGRPGVRPRWHARALMDLDRWFLTSGP